MYVAFVWDALTVLSIVASYTGALGDLNEGIMYWFLTVYYIISSFMNWNSIRKMFASLVSCVVTVK